MPYPMTRLRVRVGGEEFNSHSFAPCLVLWIWPRALLALFKTLWFDVSLRQGDSCISSHMFSPIRRCRVQTPFDAGSMRSHPVSTRVNTVGNSTLVDL